MRPLAPSHSRRPEQYAFVGHPRLLKRLPLQSAAQAKQHTLLDVSEVLPLYRYWRDATGGIDSLKFGRVVRLGFVLRGDGVAVLPAYFIERDLRAGRLTIILPKVRPLTDYFRLVFRIDDSRRSVYQRLAESMRSHPLH